MFELLLSHHVHVIALGDPGQLPPIEGESKILAHPHVFLDEIVRQAQDSAIIRLSMDIREGLPLKLCKGNEVSIIPKSRINDIYYAGADQIIAAKNITRAHINWNCRQIKFDKDIPNHPIDGDKAICLKNYWGIISNQGDPTINGMIGTLNKVEHNHNVYKYGNQMFADFIIGDNNQFESLFMDYKLFAEGKPTVNNDTWQGFRGMPKPLLFDYGYCITCHKGQGSEWDKVLVINEYMQGTDWKRWAYTAVTRARKKLIMAVDY
jgi:exodeoxyribonuclease-5